MQQTSSSTLQNNSSAIVGSTAISRGTMVQIFGAILFGIVMLYGIGFASMNVAHNAAHDTRHAIAFPCH